MKLSLYFLFVIPELEATTLLNLKGAWEKYLKIPPPPPYPAHFPFWGTFRKFFKTYFSRFCQISELQFFFSVFSPFTGRRYMPSLFTHPCTRKEYFRFGGKGKNFPIFIINGLYPKARNHFFAVPKLCSKTEEDNFKWYQPPAHLPAAETF